MASNRWTTLAGATLAALALVAGGGCDKREVIDEENPPDYCAGGYLGIRMPIQDQLDVLFVLDNSGGMSEEQDLLRAAFDDFLAGLDAGPHGRPDLHVGLVTTDVGAGIGNTGIGCSANGHNGRLFTQTAGPDCQPADNAYIIDRRRDGGDGRVVNYPGTLTQAFNCLTYVGVGGCGFEQPLESMRRALAGSHPANSGFLRTWAPLLVIIVANEDDCSAFDTSVFDSTQNSPTDPLGPLSSFRCFDFGVRCDPDVPRESGEKSDCRPRADSPYIADVAAYVDFLSSLKPRREWISVAVISGPPEPVTVVENFEVGAGHLLEPSCSSEFGAAIPGVRLAAFAEAFGATGSFASICAVDYSEPLIDVASRAVEGTIGQCLDSDPGVALVDSDGDGQNGIQPICAVYTLDPFSGDQKWSECDHPSEPQNAPCYVIEPAQVCADTPSGLRVRTVLASPEDRGPNVVARCVTEETPSGCLLNE